MGDSIEARIYRTGLVLLGAFLLLVITATYWQVVGAEALELDPLVTGGRLLAEEARVRRGQILDRNGAVLATTEQFHDGTRRRRYTEPSAVHAVGYQSVTHGKGGIEQVEDAVLSGRAGATALSGLVQDLLHLERQGGDVRLTLDLRVQQAAVEAFGDGDGAVVAIDPRSGDVLALASRPVYDPNRLDESWQEIQDHPSRPLLNRALQSLYVPGSTFKTVTLAAAMEHRLLTGETPVSCPEQLDVFGFPIVSHNELPGRSTRNIADAFAYSCNTVFADLGLRLGAESLTAMAASFGITEAPPFPLETAAGRVGAPDFLAGPQGLAVTSFGQGELQLSPLHLALIPAAVANGGVLLQPRLVDRGASTVWRRVMSGDTARALGAIMEHAGRAGHGAPNIAISGVRIGTKTGSAELQAGQSPHAVFLAFAPVENPRVAVAVLKERGGSGSLQAAPVARAVIQAVLQPRS